MSLKVCELPRSFFVSIFLIFWMPYSLVYGAEYYGSAVLGVSDVELSGVVPEEFDAELSYGIRLGWGFSEKFSTGILINKFISDEGLNSELDVLNVLFELSYFTGHRLRNSFWAGALVGWSEVDADSSPSPSSSFESSDFSLGAIMGYQFRLNNMTTLGPQVVYLRIFRGSGEITEITGQGNFTFWF
ncbi:MAG: hypothetical protein AAF203_03410 [Pseudomonadota bacterium]